MAQRRSSDEDEDPLGTDEADLVLQYVFEYTCYFLPYTNKCCRKAKLGEEERNQWSDMTWEIMEQVLQLRRGDQSTGNTRTFRGLALIKEKGEWVEVHPKVHQLYDLIWRRLRVDEFGGAINADEPGFGKVSSLCSFGVSDSIVRFEHADVNVFSDVDASHELDLRTAASNTMGQTRWILRHRHTRRLQPISLRAQTSPTL